MSDFDVPLARNASYGTLYALGPPPSPPPPHPPAVPPSPPAPPAAPPYPPLPWTYEFVFSALRPWTPPAAEVQISEVRLFGESGERLDIVEASNPGGYPGPGEAGQDKTAMAAVDGTDTTKWLDINATAMAIGAASASAAAATSIPISSWLQLTLDRPAIVVQYELVTANDNPGRDPIEWAFGIRHSDADGGGFELLSTAGYPPLDGTRPMAASRRVAAVAAHRAATSGAAAGAAVATVAPRRRRRAARATALAAVCVDSAFHLHGGARLSHRSDQLAPAVEFCCTAPTAPR